MWNTGGGVLGLLVLIGVIYAIIKTVQSSVADSTKILWVLILVLLPLIGLIIWFFIGPGGRNV